MNQYAEDFNIIVLCKLAVKTKKNKECFVYIDKFSIGFQIAQYAFETNTELTQIDEFI